jgi:hypothetical protein
LDICRSAEDDGQQKDFTPKLGGGPAALVNEWPHYIPKAFVFNLTCWMRAARVRAAHKPMYSCRTQCASGTIESGHVGRSCQSEDETP